MIHIKQCNKASMIALTLHHIIGKTGFWKKVKVLFLKSSHSLCILPHNRKLIKTYFTIFELTWTDNSPISVRWGNNHINLCLFLCFRITAPPLSDWNKDSSTVVRVTPSPVGFTICIVYGWFRWSFFAHVLDAAEAPLVILFIIQN